MKHFVLEMKGLIKQTQAPFGSIKVKLCQQKYRKCQLERFSLAWSGDPVHTRGSSPNTTTRVGYNWRNNIYGDVGNQI